MQKSLNILVTGAAGQVGSELAQYQKQFDTLDIIAAPRNILDICDTTAIQQFVQQHQIDLIINAAAYTAVDQAEDEQEQAFAINHLAAQNLAQVCKAQNIPLFHLSTDYVFSGKKEGAYLETDIPEPESVYGKSKLAGEKAIQKILPQHLILRVAWVFGLHGNNFVKTMIRLGRERSQLSIVDDQFGGPTPAADIAGTLLQLAQYYQQHGNMPWGIYHYCGAPVTSWYGFANAIFSHATDTELLNKQVALTPIPSSAYPAKAPRPANSNLDCKKIFATFQIQPADWQQALHQVLRELKNHDI